MIVDCHTHVDLGSEGAGISEHLSSIEKVDVCMVLAGANGSSVEVNERLSEYVGKYKEKMVGLAVVNPVEDNIGVKKVSSLPEKLGLRGAVLYCSASGFHPAHSRAMRFYESAQEVGLPVFFHNSGELGAEAVLDYSQPYLLDEVARTYPDLKIIIGSMGMPFTEQTLTMLAKHKNVYADLTLKPDNVWQVYNIVVAAYERGVMNKLLFGSGFPLSSAGECMETLLGFNKLLGDTNLPIVPRANIRGIVERDTLGVLGITM